MMVWMAWIAAALVFASFFMKTIVPLRGLAIASNVAFIAFAAIGARNGLFAEVLPILVLHCALLPLNALRLWQVLDAIRGVRSMRAPRATADLLTPYMQPLSCPAGTVLFRRDDRADLVYVIRSGTVRLDDLGKTLSAGELFGEIGVFNEGARRTATAVCDSDCELFAVSGERILELFYQDQRFAFQIARGLSRYAWVSDQGTRP